MSKGNPFTVAGNWYKGNLHLHTTTSDGKATPEELVAWYRAAGYDFLSITDHQVVTLAKPASRDGLLVIPGIEFHGIDAAIGGVFHLLAVGMAGLTVQPDGLGAQELIHLAREQGGEAMLCHPYWLGQTAGELKLLRGCLAVEVYNHVCAVTRGKGLSSSHWDDLLDRGRRLWGLAVDDAHRLERDADGGWIMLRAPSLTQESVMAALRAGHFYASTGPEITDLRLQGGAVAVKCSPVVAVNFIAARWQGGRVQAEEGQLLTQAQFRLRGDEKYLRVECVDAAGRAAWANPFYLRNEAYPGE